MAPSDSKGVVRREAVRVWLLGEFRVHVGPRTITQDAWHLRKSAALVKLLALAPGHRVHREQAMDLLWPNSGTRAASNSLRKALHKEEVAALVAQGLNNRQIASELSISEHTAATHVRRIFKKLGFHSRAELASWVSTQQSSS